MIALASIAASRAARLALRLAPYAAIAVLLAALLLTRGTLARVKAEAATTVARQQAAADRATAAAAVRVTAASDAYAARAAALTPIIIRSKDTVTTYAQTPAGRAVCLAADRVRGIDDLDAALFDPARAGGGSDAVPAEPGAAPTGR